MKMRNANATFITVKSSFGENLNQTSSKEPVAKPTQ